MIALFPGSSYSGEERILYIYLLASYFIVIGLVIAAIARHHLYLFEPFSIITLLYFGIFIFRPIQDVFTHSVAYAGNYLAGAGPKATVIFTLGFTAFYFGYYSPKKERVISPKTRGNDNRGSIPGLVIMWAVCFVFCILSSLSQGISLTYLFSLSSHGERVETGGSAALLFLSNFATSMLVVWLMILVKSKSIVLKITISVLTGIYIIMRNARWLVLIMGFSPLVYYYTKRRKSPKMISTFLVCFAALVAFAWMQMNRYNIATGREIQWFHERGGLTFELLFAPFDSDLTTYTTFYGMVSNYPKLYPYMFGQTFLYVFVLFIPRVLWAAKPDNPVRDMVEHSLGALARANGRAVANIGEFYANFGVLGVIILMFVFGYIVSKLKTMYEQPTENRLVMYSILYPLLFQWVARGNFSGNFYYTLFAYLPIMIQWFVNNVSRRKI